MIELKNDDEYCFTKPDPRFLPMKNQNDVIALNIASPITSLIQDTDKFGKTSGGKEMYERIAKNTRSGMFNTQKKLAE